VGVFHCDSSVYRELLHQYRPHLYATFDEFSPPVAVESMLDHGYLVDLETEEVITDESGSPIALSQEVLKEYDQEKYAIKLHTDYTRLYGSSHQENFENSEPVVYARAVEDRAEKILALQYFFFFAGSYTGKLLVPIQMKWHEGDTEYAQILLNLDTLQPVGATSSIHYYGLTKGWGELLKAEDGRVKMYVAQHSHATYFSPSTGWGHQAMVGNLGFGGELIVSLKTVWDPCSEDRLIDYELRIPEEDSMVFQWKGRWGAKKKYLDSDDGAKSRELGPRSFAYRNALSKSLSMYHDPARFAYFYYHPSALYQKLVLATKEIEDEEIMERVFELMISVGRLRAKVDYALMNMGSEISPEQARILAEATPFVVFAAKQKELEEIYAAGQKKIGASNFRKIVRSIAKKQLKVLNHAIQVSGLDVQSILQEPLNLFKIRPKQLESILSTLTNLPRKFLYKLYLMSASARIGDELYLQ